MPGSDQSPAPRIVVGVDGSPSSVEALRWAVRYAELSGGTVDATITWQYPITASGLGWAPTSPWDDTNFAELAAKTLSDVVADVSPPPAVTVRQSVVEGNAGEALIEAAKGADLLVLGNRGHGSITDALIGSVSIRCLHHAACPVLVVKEPKAHH
jgi:nucleotide-binding universal stress UspA family protein